MTFFPVNKTGMEYCESKDMIKNKEECTRSSCCEWNADEEGSGDGTDDGNGRCWSAIGNQTCFDMNCKCLLTSNPTAEQCDFPECSPIICALVGVGRIIHTRPRRTARSEPGIGTQDYSQNISPLLTTHFEVI